MKDMSVGTAGVSGIPAEKHYSVLYCSRSTILIQIFRETQQILNGLKVLETCVLIMKESPVLCLNDKSLCHVFVYCYTAKAKGLL